jgi:hypothetical protein
LYHKTKAVQKHSFNLCKTCQNFVEEFGKLRFPTVIRSKAPDKQGQSSWFVKHSKEVLTAKLVLREQNADGLISHEENVEFQGILPLELLIYSSVCWAKT